jgi:hypothetical protein
MKNPIRMTLALALLCAAMSTAALASENAYMYLVHGVPGRDYSTTTDPQFPVDVLLNNETCYEHGLTYGTIIGPLTFVPGSYDVKVSVANSLAPCSNAPILDSTVALTAGLNTSVVFALNDTGALALSTFTNLFSPVTENYGRVLLAQAADAPAVTVTLEDTTTNKTYAYTVNPGELLDESLPAANYTVEVSEGTTTLIPSTTLDLYSQSVTMLFTTGEASNNTVTLETKTVRNVI